jgi:hypothetical protein
MFGFTANQTPVTGAEKTMNKGNEKAAQIFGKAIGKAVDDRKGNFILFVSNGSLKLDWAMRRKINQENNVVKGLILSVKPSEFYPPKTDAQKNLIMLAYLQFIKVAKKICDGNLWELEFETVDDILYSIIKPGIEYKEPSDPIGTSRQLANLEKNRLAAEAVYGKALLDLPSGGDPFETSKNKEEKKEGGGAAVVKRPFYLCRAGICDGLKSDCCICDDSGCCDDDDSLVRSFDRLYGRSRKPYWSTTNPGRIVVLGRSGTSAAAADLKRRYPGKEVHVRKWGPSANSYLRENPLTSRNQLEVYRPSAASPTSLRAVARASRKGPTSASTS